MRGMVRWVLLLRGVNVNGVKVTSAALREVCEGAGLARVRTVRASGNVVVDVPEKMTGPVLRALVEAALRERFGYEAFVVVVTAEDLREVCAGYPFERDDAAQHPYVVFTSDRDVLAAAVASTSETADDAEEQVRPAGDVAYWRCPKGSSTDTPFARLISAARYKPYLTTRNLRTLGEVLAAAEG